MLDLSTGPLNPNLPLQEIPRTDRNMKARGSWLQYSEFFSPRHGTHTAFDLAIQMSQP